MEQSGSSLGSCPKGRKFKSYSPHLSGLAAIVYREVDKDSFTHYRHSNMVNPSKTDIPKTQKVLFRTSNEVNSVRK